MGVEVAHCIIHVRKTNLIKYGASPSSAFLSKLPPGHRDRSVVSSRQSVQLQYHKN